MYKKLYSSQKMDLLMPDNRTYAEFRLVNIKRLYLKTTISRQPYGLGSSPIHQIKALFMQIDVV